MPDNIVARASYSIFHINFLRATCWVSAPASEVCVSVSISWFYVVAALDYIIAIQRGALHVTRDTGISARMTFNISATLFVVWFLVSRKNINRRTQNCQRERMTEGKTERKKKNYNHWYVNCHRTVWLSWITRVIWKPFDLPSTDAYSLIGRDQRSKCLFVEQSVVARFFFHLPLRHNSVGRRLCTKRVCSPPTEQSARPIRERERETSKSRNQPSHSLIIFFIISPRTYLFIVIVCLAQRPQVRKRKRTELKIHIFFRCGGKTIW